MHLVYSMADRGMLSLLRLHEIPNLTARTPLYRYLRGRTDWRCCCPAYFPLCVFAAFGKHGYVLCIASHSSGA
jgi:hypothetical protein